MPQVVHLLLLVFAFVFACVSAWLAGPGLTWQRALSVAFACLVASMISWTQ